MPLDIGGHIISDSSITNDGFNKSIIQDGLVLHLDAGNKNSYSGTGTTWTDLSYIGNNGTLTNGPTYSSSDGGSFIFDGTDDYVNLGDNSILRFTGSCTYSCWFYITGTGGTNPRLISKSGNSSARSMDLFYQNNDNLLRFSVAPTTSTISGVTSTSTVSQNTWYNIAGVYDSSNQTLKIYINGNEDNSTTGPSSITNNNNRDYWIGAGNRSIDWFDGNLPQAFIYNRALHKGEILANYYATKDRF